MVRRLAALTTVKVDRQCGDKVASLRVRFFVDRPLTLLFSVELVPGSESFLVWHDSCFSIRHWQSNPNSEEQIPWKRRV